MEPSSVACGARPRLVVRPLSPDPRSRDRGRAQCSAHIVFLRSIRLRLWSRLILSTSSTIRSTQYTDCRISRISFVPKVSIGKTSQPGRSLGYGSDKEASPANGLYRASDDAMNPAMSNLAVFPVKQAFLRCLICVGAPLKTRVLPSRYKNPPAVGPGDLIA